MAAAPARAEVGAYLLFDMDDGTVLAAHEATTPWYPASITKLMTAYVTFQAIADGRLAMTSPVKISPQAFQQPPSRMGFSVGTVITVETALRIILTKSANDVSVALAEAVGGTQTGFVERMNATAAKLDMATSQFDNPHGLPNTKQITSARDIALLMMALQRDFPDYADFFSMGGVQLGNKLLTNHNALIRRFPGADGMKTGFICASGFNLAASATRDGKRLGAVVLGGLTSHERDQRTAELLEKGFEAVKNGGVVALDGFDDLGATLSLAPVAGERAPMGLVAALEVDPEVAVADRQSEVCGAKRPATRYDEGTVATRGEVEAQRVALLAYQGKVAAQESGKAKILAEPRILPGTELEAGSAESDDLALSPPPSRAFAEVELLLDGWESGHPGASPVRHPNRAAVATVEVASGPVTISDFAPSDWIPSPARPHANPFEVADLRAPPGARPPALPLSYLGPSRAITPIPIAIGGADEARPDPLSGQIVGGGPAPMPRVKPPRLVTLFNEEETPTDPDLLIRHAAEVRGTVARSE
ncbi:D-alanyl-D-alanine carboxypeptidase family protein [Acuticoccus kandeliae]|uniref:D-alanyl-D-alanine carboxypeptidase family protein n=1 Tax=Acuticoccus kandeliae TaxID=2073160 RepID=UPI000D3E2052|nr:D-alanyl-D-alanine carboxypeptidase family protein [Acuticoccus kandeliae]